jgi:hypothetical protein
MKTLNLLKNTKLLAVLLSALLVADLQAAEVAELEIGNVTAKVETVCIKGYLYAVVVSSRGDVSIVQMFKRFNNFANPPSPIQCKSN